MAIMLPFEAKVTTQPPGLLMTKRADSVFLLLRISISAQVWVVRRGRSPGGSVAARLDELRHLSFVPLGQLFAIPLITGDFLDCALVADGGDEAIDAFHLTFLTSS